MHITIEKSIMTVNGVRFQNLTPHKVKFLVAGFPAIEVGEAEGEKEDADFYLVDWEDWEKENPKYIKLEEFKDENVVIGYDFRPIKELVTRIEKLRNPKKALTKHDVKAIDHWIKQVKAGISLWEKAKTFDSATILERYLDEPLQAIRKIIGWAG